MMRTLASSDGTTLAYEVLGEGPPILFVAGMLSDRETLRPIAQGVRGHSCLLYDRRGRGDSANGGAYSVAREIEDLAALSGLFDEPPVLFGHSSGAGLVIEAAAAGLPAAGIVLFEPPYGFDDEQSRRESLEFAQAIKSRIDQGEHEAAVRYFFGALGLPDDAVDAMVGDGALVRRAPTMLHDLAVMGQLEGGGEVPEARLRQIVIPALVLSGDQSPDFFAEISRLVARQLPNGSFRQVAGEDHSASGGEVAAIVEEFAARVRGKRA